ncbi:hypothetical protein PV350_12245 [Streptomyces sp. PA03-6a]|nr:hypothetical protein [Streptomyces sp. PA03-6a]
MRHRLRQRAEQEPALRLSTSVLLPGTGFHQVHASDGARIRHRRVCEREEVGVPQSDIARGRQRPDGRTVVLLDEDLAALPLPTKRTVDVLGFVDERDVYPMLYAKPYWVGAAGEQGQRPYALLVEALALHGCRRQGHLAHPGAPGGPEAAARHAAGTAAIPATEWVSVIDLAARLLLWPEAM